ncbi:MAG: hypothetical protein M1828_000782 [Chrysothrix sp. TS-e1954]|nr:MAG: hypothetical protein M1828_000782 [Chrysothrix sp. TS-e1954]
MFKNRFSFRRKTSKEDASPVFESSDPLAIPTSHEDHGDDTTASGQTNDLVQRLRTSDAATSRGRSPVDTRDPLGLQVLHNPGPSHKVDIVFVHGLGGTSRLSWSKNRDLHLFWPLTFLPLEPGISQGRILTFGYNASFVKTAKNSTTVLDFAKDLLFDLKYAVDEEKNDLHIGKVPIIFLVHSMGGLIAKEAYMQGQWDPNYKHLVDAISGIIFLSTPHRGTNLAETLNRILQASVISSSKQFIAELTKNSFTLQKLNEQFRHIAPRLDIVSFYETQMTTIGHKRIMIVERDSSVLGYPGEISRALDADHHGVCKYDSPEDPLYVAVRNVLKSLIGKLPLPGSTDIVFATPREELRHIESLLAVAEAPDVDFVFFHDRWAPNTCNWFLGERVFLEWQHDSSAKSRILWLHGNAASGKSVLASFVIDHLAQAGLPCQYFFVRFGDQEKCSLSNLLRSLIFQLCQVFPSFRHGIRPLVDEAMNFDAADARSIWNRVFKAVLFKLPMNAPLYWVIDGLDESHSPSALVRLFSELNASNVPIRAFIVSRKTNDLLSSFQKLSIDVSLDIIVYEGNSDDIRLFIDRELDVPGDDNFRAYIKNQVMRRANGNFLWVHLAVGRINRCHTAANVENALRQLPPGMESLYDRMAETIATLPNDEDRRLALLIIEWVACAIRLLTMAELCMLLEGNTAQPLDLQRSIGDLCGGFVVLDNGLKIAMVHQTARAYLINSSTRLQPFAIDRMAANAKLFMQCMHLLKDSSLRLKLRRKQTPAFLDYAASSCFYHLVNGPFDSREMAMTLKGFFDSNAVLTWIQALAHFNKLRQLVTAAALLTTFTMKREIEAPAEITRVENKMFRAWAIELVKVVAKFGSNLVGSPEAVYKLVPPFCPRNSLMYQQFGKKESGTLQVGGRTLLDWDDSLTRLSFGADIHATLVRAAGSRIAVMSPSGTVIIYYSSTCEENRRIKHGERILKMNMNAFGTTLVTYGFRTTKAWNLATGVCIMSVPNLDSRPRPHSITLVENDAKDVLIGFEDRTIRSLSLKDRVWSWKDIVVINERPLKGMNINCPACMAVCSDGLSVVLGYRGYPVSVWEMDGPQLVGHCYRVANSTGISGKRAYGEVVQVTWHPSSGEVLGLYLEGAIFKWHPYYDEIEERQTGAVTMAVSPDGRCIAAGDPHGIIKLYDLSTFNLVYQFASQNPVYDMAFAPDARRLYDVRGPIGNAWEPNALLRLVEAAEASVDSGVDSSETVQYTSGKIYQVTALAAQSTGRLYCSGTGEGVIQLFETTKSESTQVYKPTNRLRINQVAWSNDGKYVAFVDLYGRIFVRSVQRTSPDNKRWSTETKLNLSAPYTRQILFHPDSASLLVYTNKEVDIISVDSGAVLASRQLPEHTVRLKWISHPASLETLLVIAPGRIHLLAWATLHTDHTVIFPSIVSSHMEELTRSKSPSSSSPSSSLPSVDRVCVTRDGEFALVQSSRTVERDQKQRETILLDITTIIPATDTGKISPHDAAVATSSEAVSSQELQPVADPFDCETTEEIQTVQLPEDSISRVGYPLSFLSNDRLVFIDEDYWLCSWKLPLPDSANGRRRSVGGTLANGTADIHQHYFFPRDWISPDALASCTITADATVLYPRNGEVAEVRCASLRA